MASPHRRGSGTARGMERVGDCPWGCTVRQEAVCRDLVGFFSIKLDVIGIRKTWLQERIKRQNHYYFR